MRKKRQILLDCIRRQLAKPECFYRQRECIESCLVANELPLYPSDKFLDVSHLKQLPSRQPVITEIPLSAIWGNVWLFSGNPQEFFRNLDYRILASTLLGFMRNPDNVTPVCVCRVKITTRWMPPYLPSLPLKPQINPCGKASTFYDPSQGPQADFSPWPYSKPL